MNVTVHERGQAEEEELHADESTPNQVIGHHVSTYASLVAPEEGTTLKFVQMEKINGKNA